MSINDSCPCYPWYAGLPQSPVEPFVPGGGVGPPPSPEEYVDIPLTLLNPGFEDAAGGNHTTPDNWTSEPVADDFIVDNGNKGIDPFTGVYSAMGRDIAECTGVSTAIDLVAGGVAEWIIDGGQSFIRLNYKYATNKDQGAVGFRFFDSTMQLIDDVRSQFVPPTSFVWTDQAYRVSVPIGTRHVQVYLYLYRLSGNDLNANYDDLVVTYESLAKVATDLDLRWNIGTSVFQDLLLEWDIQ